MELEQDNESLVHRTAKAIVESKKTIALTGAGISVESDIPPFRGKCGLWSKYDPEEYAHIDSFIENPEKIWKMLKELLDIIRASNPNPAHVGLAKLEELGYLSCIITQNVDGLHQVAGSTDVIEFHGNNRDLICLDCGKKYPAERYLDQMPPRCECKAILKPNAVFFGEPIPYESLTRAFEEAKTCDLLLVVGTSAVVAPASHIPAIAKGSNATVVEINSEVTSLTGFVSDYLIQGQAGEIVSKIIEEVLTFST